MPPYNDSGDSADMESPEPDQSSNGEGDYKSFWLPPEAVAELPPDSKAGDIVKFKIVGKDAEGNVEVVCEHGEMTDKEDMHNDLVRSMPASMGGTYGEENE